jgi:hypothetical protein
MARGSAPGERRGGRSKGTPNKNSTRVLREAVLDAAEQVGNDGKGKDGLTGYLKHVALTDAKAFTSLLGRAMPLQVEGGDPNKPVAMQIITGVPRAGD